MNDNGTNNKKMMWGFCGLWHYLVVLYLQTIDTKTYSHRCLRSPEAEWMNNGANNREKMLLFLWTVTLPGCVVSADHWHDEAEWMNNGANKREKMLLLFFVDCDATWHVVSADHWHGAAQAGGAAGHITRQDAALLYARCLPRPWGWESVMADGHQPLFPDTWIEGSQNVAIHSWKSRILVPHWNPCPLWN